MTRLRRRPRAALLVVPMLLAASTALAGAYPRVVAIDFEGNEVTQPKTLLREMWLKVGDEADPEQVERSRQAVQDLGLFRSVSVREEPAEGGVRLVFKVKEKFYILPLPRTDVSSDGGYAYGAQLRWSNMWGLNHSFTPYYERRQPSEGADDPETRGIQTRLQLRYVAPYLFDTPYTLGFFAGRHNVPYLQPLQYEETQRSLSIGLSRRLTDTPGSQGWSAGLGVNWRSHEVSGFDAFAVQAEGRAVSLVAAVGHRDLHFNIYSDSGMTSTLTVESAGREYGSDYHFTTWNAYHAHYLPLGSTPHQTVHFIGLAGARHGGAPGAQEHYTLGGVESLRGFEPETAQGDAFYLLRAEYLRPVFRNSIRALAVIDAGNAFVTPREADLHTVLVSGGLGVRVRFQAFVSFEVELGVAWPLNGGPPRIFASKV